MAQRNVDANNKGRNISEEMVKERSWEEFRRSGLLWFTFIWMGNSI